MEEKNQHSRNLKKRQKRIMLGKVNEQASNYHSLMLSEEIWKLKNKLDFFFYFIDYYQLFIKSESKLKVRTTWEMVERLHMNNDAARHVQAYIEYDAIVGTDDGGKAMSEQEFEEYKARVREKRANRLYTNWRNLETGADCKAIGPASQCFCGHRYKEHNFDNVENKQVSCKDKRCKCRLFSYIPIFGSQDFRCNGCKHSNDDHNCVTLKCTRPNCKCAQFSSRHSCSCGSGYNVHDTVFESRQEREASGRQVDAPWLQASNMVGGMGGLVDFGSLADDQDRQDMMNPNAIMGNMHAQGQIMGGNMQQQMLEAESAATGGRGQRLAIQGGSAGRGSRGGARGGSRGVGESAATSQEMVPVGGQGGQPSLLDLFNTPHGFGGRRGGGGATQVTSQMRRLKM